MSVKILNTYTLKQYKEEYSRLLDKHLKDYEDHNEFTFINNEIESYYDTLIDIDGIEDLPFQYKFSKSYSDRELNEALLSQKEFKEAAIKSNLSSSMIIHFLEQRKQEITSHIVEKMESTKMESFYDFFEATNKREVSELEIINFIERVTGNDLRKLEALKSDLDEFEIRFTAGEIVNDYFSNKASNSIGISEKFNRLKEVVLIEIESAKSKTAILNNGEIKPIKDYKSQNLFKVGLLFASGKMNEYFTVGKEKRIITNEGYSAPSISAELKLKYNVEIHRLFISASMNNYLPEKKNGEKNIFNSLDMMNKIISHCEENNIEVDTYFKSRLPIEQTYY